MTNTEKLLILKSKEEVEQFRKLFDHLNIPDFCNLTFLTNDLGQHVETGYVLKLNIKNQKIESIKFAPKAIINNYFNLNKFIESINT